MRLRDVPDRAEKALLLARRRVMTTLAERTTPSHLRDIAHFSHPAAPRLSRALERIRAREEGEARLWIDRIESERARLLASDVPLSKPGEPAGPYDEGVTVGSACRVSRRPEDAVALFHLVYAMVPERVIELGTNVGISSAYMAAAQHELGRGSLTTLEASPGRAATARALHRNLGLSRVDYVLGLFDQTLDAALAEPVDFAFIDGHHQFEPTLDYFDRIWRRSKEGAVFVFDDIRWSLGMERAWNRLRVDPRLVLVADLCGLGVAIGTREPRATGRLVTPVLSV